MEYVHRCVVCDWERAAASPTVTSPRCDNCGCALEAFRASDGPARRAPAEGLQVPEPMRAGLIRFASLAGAALVMLAAARTGYTEGGLAIAVTAFGAAGLLMVMTMSTERA